MDSDTRLKGDIAKKILKIVLKILYQILIILCILLILVILMQKISDSNKSLLGYRLFRVVTGSMEPEYDIGVVVLSKEIPVNDINVGDDIVYFGKYGDYMGKIIMHEVVAIDKDENGNNYNFHAKGLHSTSTEDPQIKADQIYGVVKFKSKILTILYELATSIYSSFVIVTILVLNVFMSFKCSGKQYSLPEHYEEDVEEQEEEYFEEDVEVEEIELEEEEDKEDTNED